LYETYFCTLKITNIATERNFEVTTDNSHAEEMHPVVILYNLMVSVCFNTGKRVHGRSIFHVDSATASYRLMIIMMTDRGHP